MPSEPEKNIEPLLKAYAGQRRKAGGPDPVMHPATRALLQAEVRRRYPGGASGPEISQEPSWWLSLKMFWPRFAFAGGIAAVLCTTLWWMNRSTPGKEEEFAAASPATIEKAQSPAPESEMRIGSADAKSAGPAGTMLAAAPAAPPAPAPTVDRVVQLAPPAPVATTAPAPTEPASTETLASVPARRTRFAAGAPAAPAEFRRLDLASSSTATQSDGAQVASAAPATRTARPVSSELSAASDAVEPLTRASANRPEVRSRVLKDESAPAATGPVPASAPAVASGGADAGVAASPVRALFRNTQRPSVQLFAESARSTELKLQEDAPRRLAAVDDAAGQASAKAIADRGYKPGTALTATGGVGGMAGDDAGRQAPGPEVFSNFTIEQSGSTVRIIDDDGSVYAGQLRQDATYGEARLDSAGNEGRTNTLGYGTRAPAPAASAPVKQAEAGAVASAGTSLEFEVSGTNETLRQPVVFFGRLLIESPSTAAPVPALIGAQDDSHRFKVQQQPPAQRGAVAPISYSTLMLQQSSNRLQQSPSAPYQILRVQGTGRVGAGRGSNNEVRVDAVPAQSQSRLPSTPQR